MNRIVLGAVSALSLAGAGLFWWQGRAATEAAAPPPPVAAAPDAALPMADDLPDEDGAGLQGPALPRASEATREQKRFNRLDRNRDDVISRTEALAPRVAAFRKLDVDQNNLLSFEEWAVATSNRFRKADADGNAQLTRAEFATTKPRPAKKPACRC